MASKLSILFMRICLSLTVAEGIQSPAGTRFWEIVKEAWSAIEKIFVDPTYNRQDWTAVHLSSEPLTIQGVRWDLKPEGRMRIRYIALAEFTGNAPVQVRQAIQLANILVFLSDDSALIVSTHQSRTPAGHEIEGKGITL